MGVGPTLLDTGPLVAFVDRGDPAHAEVVPVMEGARGLLITTCAVVTEAMHFLARVRAGPEALGLLLAASGVRTEHVSDLAAATDLMRRYADTPMDFADATLLLTADRTRATRILTLDRRGFATYRTAAGNPLAILP